MNVEHYYHVFKQLCPHLEEVLFLRHSTRPIVTTAVEICIGNLHNQVDMNQTTQVTSDKLLYRANVYSNVAQIQIQKEANTDPADENIQSRSNNSKSKSKQSISERLHLIGDFAEEAMNDAGVSNDQKVFTNKKRKEHESNAPKARADMDLNIANNRQGGKLLTAEKVTADSLQFEENKREGILKKPRKEELATDDIEKQVNAMKVPELREEVTRCGLKTSAEATKIKKPDLRVLLIDFKRSQIIRNVENFGK